MNHQYIRVTDITKLQKLIKTRTNLYIKDGYNNYKFVNDIFDLTQDVYVLYKKSTITINKIVLTAPVKVSELVKGNTYYVASLSRPEYYFSTSYKSDSDTAYTAATRGVLFNTSKDAKNYILAINNYLRS